jgi:hypothetical protein
VVGSLVEEARSRMPATAPRLREAHG